MPGLIEIIEWLSAKKIPMALASSSPMQLINGLMKHYGIFNVFQVICSAEHEEQGKPHPAVFLTTSRKLALLPEELLVFEDSFNGVIAAKAARMKCVAIPAKEHYNQTRFTAADLVLPSLSVFASSHWDRLQ
jgi:sugar-phosphatase